MHVTFGLINPDIFHHFAGVHNFNHPPEYTRPFKTLLASCNEPAKLSFTNKFENWNIWIEFFELSICIPIIGIITLAIALIGLLFSECSVIASNNNPSYITIKVSGCCSSRQTVI